MSIVDMSTHSTQPKITIFRGWKDPDKHVWSPFVIKLEARLRFAGIKYSVGVGSPKTAPKGKIPYVEWDNLPSEVAEAEEDKVQLGDSALIIKALLERNIIPDINAELSPADRAKDMALRALLEDKLYFYHVSEAPVTLKLDTSVLILERRLGKGGFKITIQCATTSFRRCHISRG